MEELKPYCHQVQYYETDMMGITHHANYIHWMEEARVDFMDQIGYPYKAMEDQGIGSPVTKVSVEYKHPSTFGDRIAVKVSVVSFTGVRIVIGYTMCNQDRNIVCEGTSEHVFMNREKRLVRMKQQLPGFCAAIEEVMQKQAEK